MSRLMCCRVMCAYYAYVTIRCALCVACFGSCHFVNTVSGQHFSAENKQEAAEFHSQHLPMHFCGVIWKIKSKSNFLVSFSMISAEMNVVGYYRTLRGLRTVNPEGLPSTRGGGGGGGGVNPIYLSSDTVRGHSNDHYAQACAVKRTRIKEHNKREEVRVGDQNRR